MAKVLRINRCEECPHFRQYDPDKDPYPDVGWRAIEESCALTRMWMRHPGYETTPRPNGFPEWCPLEDHQQT